MVYRLYFLLVQSLVSHLSLTLAHRTSLMAQMVKESACSAGDLYSVAGLGRSPGEENGLRLQYSCLENSMDRGVAGNSPWGCK